MLNLLKPYWLQIVKWTVIIGGGLLVVLRIFSAGRKHEKVEQIERTIENVKEARRVEKTINSVDDDELERLRQKWTRK